MLIPPNIHPKISATPYFWTGRMPIPLNIHPKISATPYFWTGRMPIPLNIHPKISATPKKECYEYNGCSKDFIEDIPLTNSISYELRMASKLFILTPDCASPILCLPYLTPKKNLSYLYQTFIKLVLDVAHYNWDWLVCRNNAPGASSYIRSIGIVCVKTQEILVVW